MTHLQNVVEKDSTAIASNVPKIDLSLQWHANFLDTVLILEILPDISSINHSDFVICADQAADKVEMRGVVGRTNSALVVSTLPSQLTSGHVHVLAVSHILL